MGSLHLSNELPGAQSTSDDSIVVVRRGRPHTDLDQSLQTLPGIIKQLSARFLVCANILSTLLENTPILLDHADHFTMLNRA